jgi:hypothetical protein
LEQLENRYRNHARIGAELGRASDEELLRLVGAGSGPRELPRCSATVFAKLVPLTALEMQPENRRSTANVFGLPAYYQYRLGGCGFGAWRELAIHERANEWITSGRCAGFPLLHHWRVLPVANQCFDDRMDVQRWGDSVAIRERVAAVAEASHSVVLFLEYVPRTLGHWLGEQLGRHPDPAGLVVGIEARSGEILAFVRAQGVLHMDAHLENILTDGDQLYLADYGLTLSRDFDLGTDEQQFFDLHQSFDLCTAINGMVHAVVTHYEPGPDWRQFLRTLIDGSGDGANAMPPAIRSYLIRRAPLALAVGDFYARLLRDLTTPYPAAVFEQLLSTCG